MMRRSRHHLIILSILVIPILSLSSGAYGNIAREYQNQNSTAANAAQKEITGTVLSSSGAPIVGATVTTSDGRKSTTTGTNGEFVIRNAQQGDVFSVMLIGYATSQFTVNNSASYRIVMNDESLTVDEVVVVGYGTQKKASVTGSVASISSDEIVKTKNTNIQNMLTGRVPGLRVVQRTSEPGTFDMNFDIRGFGAPLIVIDGVPRNNMSRLDPNEVESISVLKDASAAVYGVQAANGVVLITTKSGTKDGKVTLNYNGNFTWQMTSGLPSTVGVVDFMRMSNEKSMTNSDGGGMLTFGLDEIQQYLNGEKKGYNWYRSTIKEFVPQTQQNVSISGGGQKTTFFVNLGYQYQEGFFSTGDLNYDRYNLRTKINTKITDNLIFDINVTGITETRLSPRRSSHQIISTLWKQFPNEPVYANDTEPYYYQVTVDEGINPMAILDTDYTGYQTNDRNWLQSSASLTYNAPFAKGLSFKGFYSFDYSNTFSKVFKKSYYLYRYDQLSDTYISTSKDSPSSVRRDYSEGRKTMYQLSVNYDRTFNYTHNVKGLLLLEGTKNKGDGFYALRELSLDIDHLFAGNAENQIGFMNTNDLYEDAQMALIGRFNYDYRGKYLAEFIFRYDGSSRFDKNHRWGFFPSGSLGYRISDEAFWKNSPLKFINSFKIRASYGVMGDDAALRYQYLTGYSYPGSSASQWPIFFGGTPINVVSDLGIPNPNITWYTAHTMNFGFDAQAWHGLLGMTFDVFQRKRSGLLATRNQTLPGTVGASLPQENLNSDKNVGFELELSHRNKIAKDLSYSVKANISLTRALNDYTERSEDRSSWDNWRNNNHNRYKNVLWGHDAGGQYQNYDHIAEFPTKTMRFDLPGGYYERDWNGDGFIDGMDLHPVGFNSTPLLNFGLSIDLAYKGFDLNALLQGAALSNVRYTERLKDPLGNKFPPLDHFLDRWRPAVEGADPHSYYTQWIPGKYQSTGDAPVGENSGFNIHNGAYVRLKNIELGYTFPSKWMSKIKIDNARIYVSGYNLLTMAHIKFVDPEHPDDNNGYMYPLNKTISVGLNLKF